MLSIQKYMYFRDMLIQQLMREINELKQELARIKAEVGMSSLAAMHDFNFMPIIHHVLHGVSNRET